MKRIAPLALLALALAACSPDKGFHSREVTADDYGARWPLTVTHAVITCGPGDVLTLAVDGRAYGIEGVGGPKDAEPGLRRIWTRDPRGDGSRLDLSPLVDDARSLCD